MGKLNKDNFRKTIYYLQKNGLKNTLYAVAERLQKKETDFYTYEAPTEAVLQAQRERSWEKPVTFSILVPLYHTPVNYFKEMVESVLGQTYPYFQLVLLDASEENAAAIIEGEAESDSAKQAQAGESQLQAATLGKLAAGYEDKRICYYKVMENKGIAENTNAGLEYATGDYIALLDHDDFLTADALYEMAAAIEEGKKRGMELALLYSDEDKCNGEATAFYEPHLKKDFDLDLLLTNNYICHFTAVKAEVFQELQLRGEYNGAQDFDLVLRVAGRFLNQQQLICHIPKILYHWRCHTSSTAVNPASKTYAYEAGKRVVEDFVKKQGWKAHAEHLKHLGFYRVIYDEEIFSQRPDLGAVGGSILDKSQKIIGGMMTASGEVVYEGLKYGFSGYMNRAALTQQAEALDIRCMMVNPACQSILEKTLQELQLTLEDYQKIEQQGKVSGKDMDLSMLSRKVSQELREAGYGLVWDPQWIKKLSQSGNGK